jgi:hypothetical protein
MHACINNVQCVEDTFSYAIGTNEMITALGSPQSLWAGTKKRLKVSSSRQNRAGSIPTIRRAALDVRRTAPMPTEKTSWERGQILEKFWTVQESLYL